MLRVNHHLHGDAYVHESFPVFEILVVGLQFRIDLLHSLDMHITHRQILVLERVHLEVVVLFSVPLENVGRDHCLSVVLIHFLVMLDVERIVFVYDREVLHARATICELKFNLGFRLFREV